MEIFTVGQLVAYLKELLEVNEALQDCWVAGEITNASQSPAGHYYFTLKEPDAQLKCVLFRVNAAWQQVRPANGLAVLVHGRVAMYEPSGSVQIIVDLIEQQGRGAAGLEFERLKEQLEAEGLFAAERKRPLPAYPQRIGLVTSAGAAAFQDILNVLRRRYPLAVVLLSPSLVQGTEAPAGICAALALLNALRGDRAPDVIILARGGGSPEDLAAFNDERVARAVFASAIPIITGVGHETDTTIVDYVADLRAPTPSAAAEIVAPDMGALLADVESLRQELYDGISLCLGDAAGDLAAAKAVLLRQSPRAQIEAHRQRVDSLAAGARVQLGHTLELERARLSGRQARLSALSPTAILERGYAILHNRRTGHIAASIADVIGGDILDARLHDGTIPMRAGHPKPG
ncbi:MAG: exodeoxyribonuclease VII large subunit [Chloroflexia bacterium]